HPSPRGHRIGPGPCRGWRQCQRGRRDAAHRPRRGVELYQAIAASVALTRETVGQSTLGPFASDVAVDHDTKAEIEVAIRFDRHAARATARKLRGIGERTAPDHADGAGDRLSLPGCELGTRRGRRRADASVATDQIAAPLPDQAMHAAKSETVR